VPAEQLKWRATGERWREQRKALGVGLREWAVRIGALPSDYCRMENGTMNPDERFEPLAARTEP
jgi:predicted transcriptional regulator